MKTSENLEFYVGRGLYDIYLVKNREREASDHIDYECEEIVARSSEGFVRVEVRTRHNCFRRPPKRDQSMDVIDEATYENARSMPDAKFITGSDRESIQRRFERKRREDSLSRQIDDLAPMCRVCDIKMIPREREHDLFWGCPQFKRCKTKTTPMTFDVKAKIRERHALMHSDWSLD